MTQFGAIAFAAPWLLLGLLALPLLWWLLRATPPAPLKQRFPGVAVLLGLDPTEKTPDRTPWWLLLLRCIIVGLAILAFAEPLMNPRDRLVGAGPLRVVMDAGWASAPDWEARKEAAVELLDQAATSSRPVRLEILSSAENGPGDLMSAPEAKARVEALEPRPWAPDRAGLLARLAEGGGDADETVWLHDGLDHAGNAAALTEALAGAGALRMITPRITARALRPVPPGEAGQEVLEAMALRASSEGPETRRVIGFEAEETGARRALVVAEAGFKDAEKEAAARFDAPLELRNRVSLMALDGAEHAGAVALIDDRWRRRRVGIVSGGRESGGRRLLSGAHYVREALRPVAELREGGVSELLAQSPDVMVLIDVAAFPEGEAAALTDWVEAGGALIRFAGPAMAAATVEARAGTPGAADPLLPVRLRPGGRDLGGAMSWGEEQRIAPFPPLSPFQGLAPPDDAAVTRQVLAEPDVDLPVKTWASLADGAPLITAEARGAGRIVLFHTSADPTWSSLPLSGLFVEIMQRAIAFGSGSSESADGTAERWRPVMLLDVTGALRLAGGAAKTITGEALSAGPGPDSPPGLYEAVSGAEEGARRALNLFDGEAGLTLSPSPPAGTAVEIAGQRNETRLRPWLLAAGLGLLFLDAVAAMALAGKLTGARRVATAAVALLVLSFVAPGAQAQDAEQRAIRAALDGALGYVLTGDAGTDEISRAGMRGLSRTLTARTTVEPPDPAPVDLEKDALAVYPLIYWGISPKQKSLSDEATAKLNAYMRDGGMLLIDTRDGNLAIGGAETPGTRALKRLAMGLDLPPLAPASEGHVLRRSFYLLDDFPGRWSNGVVWLQAEPPEDIDEVAQSGGFRNDGVSPVVIGGRDWAGAWAFTNDGLPMLPVPGGEREREMALRFGVNLIMYAYTGSYKSDQVHIPALLQRLGQ